MAEADAPRLLTLDEAARLLSVSRRTVDRLIRAGDLRTVRISPRVSRVEVDEVARYLRARRHPEDA